MLDILFTSIFLNQTGILSVWYRSGFLHNKITVLSPTYYFILFAEWQVQNRLPPALKTREKVPARSQPKKRLHDDLSSSSDEEYDSKRILEELKAAIKRKPRNSSPEPQFVAGYGAHPPVHTGAAAVPTVGPFFPPPPPPMYPPYPGAHYYLPSHYGYSMPLDLSNPSEPDEEVDSTEEVQEDANESLGRLDDDNPNLADPLTDPILDRAATSLGRWFRSPRPRGEIMDLLKQIERPANCEGLKVVEINDEVKRTMKKPHHDKDKKMKYLATGLCKAAQPLSIAWSQLVEFEFLLKQSAKKHGDPEEEASFVSIGEKTFDLSELIRYMELGLKVLGVCHLQVVQKRRLDLQYLLAPSAKELALEKQPVTDFMFGDDMQQAHKDLIAKNKVTALTSTPKKQKKSGGHGFQSPQQSSFLAHGRGSPRNPLWSSPYSTHHQGPFRPWAGGPPQYPAQGSGYSAKQNGYQQPPRQSHNTQSRRDTSSQHRPISSSPAPRGRGNRGRQ